MLPNLFKVEYFIKYGHLVTSTLKILRNSCYLQRFVRKLCRRWRAKLTSSPRSKSEFSTYWYEGIWWPSHLYPFKKRVKQLKYHRFDVRKLNQKKTKTKGFGSYQLQTRFKIRISAKVFAPEYPGNLRWPPSLTFQTMQTPQYDYFY